MVFALLGKTNLYLRRRDVFHFYQQKSAARVSHKNVFNICKYYF